MNNQDTQPKSCTCAAGPFPPNAMHFPYCALQGTMAAPEKGKCNCTASVNGGMHDSTCAIIQSEPLTAALHVHIQELSKRPLDVRMLIELEKTCLLAREMLAIGKMPNAMTRHRMIHNPNVGFGSSDGYDPTMPMPIQVGGFGGAMPAMSSPNETFGVTAIRELVAGLAALNQKNDSPTVKELKATIDRLEIELVKANKDEKPALEAIGVAS